MFKYKIYKWLPFNQDNYREFKKLEGIAEKTEFLEKILIGNIISFAKGIKWTVDNPVKLKITEIEKNGIAAVKNVKRESYDLKFTTNVSLPDYIGLGKNVSRGFGIVKYLRNFDKNE